MTDQEVISVFMERKPLAREANAHFRDSSKGWWSACGPANLMQWWPILQVCPPRERLWRLWEVEARLTDEQWIEYMDWFYIEWMKDEVKIPRHPRFILHATPEQKIAALASILRLVVEPVKEERR